MKFGLSLLPVFASGALLLASPVFAQSTAPSPAMPPSPTSMPPPDTATMQTPKGDVTINSAPAAAPMVAPAPAFEQLSGGGKSISEDQAEAYPPLANDFINADRNRDGKISKGEYQRWTKQL